MLRERINTFTHSCFVFKHMHVDIFTHISLALMSAKPSPMSGHNSHGQGSNDHTFNLSVPPTVLKI